MKVAVGTYTGNGTSQTISPSGWSGITPDFVLVKGGANNAVYAQSTMSADNTKDMNTSAALFSGGITALSPGSFSVGSDARVNQNAVAYHYLALYDTGDGDLDVLSYTGDGADNRDIAVPGITGTPTMVMVANATALSNSNPVWRATGSHSGDNASTFGAAQAANRIQSFASGGFQVGTDSHVNSNGVVYHVLALKDTASLFKSWTAYTGNGTDSRSITGVGFQPDFVLAENISGTGAAALRFSTESGDNSYQIGATTEAANKIQAFEADGFQVGTNAVVNTGSATYGGFAFKIGSSSSNIGSGSWAADGSWVGTALGIHIGAGSWAGAGSFSGSQATLQTGTGSWKGAGAWTGSFDGTGGVVTGAGSWRGAYSLVSIASREVVNVPVITPGSGGVIPITGIRPTDTIGIIIDGQGRRFGFDPTMANFNMTTVSPGGDGEAHWEVDWPGAISAVLAPVGARVELWDAAGRYWVGVLEEVELEAGPKSKHFRFTALGYMATCSDQSFPISVTWLAGTAIEAIFTNARDALCPQVSGRNDMITATGRTFVADGLKDYRGQSAVRVWNDLSYMGNAGDEKLLWHIQTPPDGSYPPGLEVVPRPTVPTYYITLAETQAAPFAWKRSSVENRVTILWAQTPVSGETNATEEVVIVDDTNSQGAYPLGIGAIRDHYVSMTGSIGSAADATALANTYLKLSGPLRPQGNQIKVQFPNRVKLADTTPVAPWRVRAGKVIEITGLDTGDPFMKTEPLLIVETQWDEPSHVLTLTTERHETLGGVFAKLLQNQPHIEIKQPVDGTNGQNGTTAENGVNGTNGIGISGNPGSDANPNGQSATLNFVFGDGVSSDVQVNARIPLRVDFDCTVTGIYATNVGGDATVNVTLGAATRDVSPPFSDDPLDTFGHLGAGAVVVATVIAANACKQVAVAVHVRRGFLVERPTV